MNILLRKQFVAVLVAVLLPLLTHAQMRTKGTFGVGLRYHTDLYNFEDLPYDDGDLSYGLSYEIHSRSAYWLIGVDYAPSAGTNGVDYVVSPQLNLIVKDRMWRGGIGILGSYVSQEEESELEDDWTDVYFQALLGVQVPFGRLSLDLLAYYVFEEWGDLGDFEFDDLEYGAWLTFSF